MMNDANSNNNNRGSNNNNNNSSGLDDSLEVGGGGGEEDFAMTDQQDQQHYHPDGNVVILKKLQRSAHIAAHMLALLSVLVVSWWIHMLGGLTLEAKGNSKLIFNYHPLLMIVAFCFMTIATLSFQHYSEWGLTERSQRKFVHGLSWTVATLCGALALIAVFKSHNDETSGYIANLYSFHSWIGIIVTILYVLQWLVGLGTFGLGYGSPSFKAVAVTIHKYIGPILYQGAAFTICLGIQEKEGFVGCSYKVESADLLPIQHFFEIPLACRVSHALGLIVVVMSILTMFAIQEFPSLHSSAIHSYDPVPLLRSD